MSSQLTITGIDNVCRKKTGPRLREGDGNIRHCHELPILIPDIFFRHSREDGNPEHMVLNSQSWSR